MKILYQDKTKEILFTSLHEALRYMNQASFACLRDARTGRLIDATPEHARDEAQALLSQARDHLNLEHIKLERFLKNKGALLEQAIQDSLNKEQILKQRSAALGYVKALMHFFVVQSAKENQKEGKM